MQMENVKHIFLEIHKLFILFFIITLDQPGHSKDNYFGTNNNSGP